MEEQDRSLEAKRILVGHEADLVCGRGITDSQGGKKEREKSRPPASQWAKKTGILTPKTFLEGL
jgi:hypothetical protein